MTTRDSPYLSRTGMTRIGRLLGREGEIPQDEWESLRTQAKVTSKKGLTAARFHQAFGNRDLVLQSAALLQTDAATSKADTKAEVPVVAASVVVEVEQPLSRRSFFGRAQEAAPAAPTAVPKPEPKPKHAAEHHHRKRCWITCCAKPPSELEVTALRGEMQRLSEELQQSSILATSASAALQTERQAAAQLRTEPVDAKNTIRRGALMASTMHKMRMRPVVNSYNAWRGFVVRSVAILARRLCAGDSRSGRSLPHPDTRDKRAAPAV